MLDHDLPDPRARRRSPSALVVAATLYCGCSGGVTAPPDLAAQSDAATPLLDAMSEFPDGPCPAVTVSATARVDPDNPVGALVDVVFANAATIQVLYGDLASYGLNRASALCATTGLGKLTIPIVGVTPGAATHIRVEGTSACDGKVGHSGDVIVDIPALPKTTPSFRLILAGTGSVRMGYIVLALGPGAGASNRAAIIDRDGRLMWYRESAAAPDRGFSVDASPGHVEVYNGASHAFDHFNLAGALVERFSDSAAPLGADGHGIVVGAGTRLMLGRGSHVEDTRGVVDGGVQAATVGDVSVDEIDAANKPGFRWVSTPEIAISEANPEALVGPADPIDPLRPTALAVDGTDPLVSFWGTGAVVRVDRAKGQIAWRLGGKKNDFTWKGDPLGGFVRPFDAHFVSPQTLLVFDGARLRDARAARVVEYTIDEQAKTATFVRAFAGSPPVTSEGGGSADRVDGDSTLIAWTDDGLITEVDGTNKLLWSVKVSVPVYRARLLPAIYPTCP